MFTLQTKIDNLREELEEMVDEMTKSPSVLSNISYNPESPDKLPDGEDRISVQSEKNADPYHLRVGSKKVLKTFSVLLQTPKYQFVILCYKNF